jgi:hypothetical protein
MEKMKYEIIMKGYLTIPTMSYLYIHSRLKDRVRAVYRIADAVHGKQCGAVGS